MFAIERKSRIGSSVPTIDVMLRLSNILAGLFDGFHNECELLSREIQGLKLRFDFGGVVRLEHCQFMSETRLLSSPLIQFSACGTNLLAEQSLALDGEFRPGVSQALLQLVSRVVDCGLRGRNLPCTRIVDHEKEVVGQ
jgi:hypothetical protein